MLTTVIDNNNGSVFYGYGYGEALHIGAKLVLMNGIHGVKVMLNYINFYFVFEKIVPHKKKLRQIKAIHALDLDTTMGKESHLRLNIVLQTDQLNQTQLLF